MRIVVSLFLILLALPAYAQGFQRVTDRAQFVSLVAGQDLSRFAVNVRVFEDGTLQGRAFGGSVTGTWTWENGYFCRNLNWGGKPYDSQCQTVEVSGETLRFTAERGAGMYADLQLD